MSTEKVRVAVVGGGRTGTPLLKALLERPFVDVVGLADVDPESEGAQIARAAGVFVTQQADVLAARGDEIDVLIEVSGDSAVKPALKNAFIAQGNKNTVIVPDIVARLIMSLASDSETLVETYHPHDTGIG
jgi:acetaldehyde dehydrogenase (acetylating)